MVGHCQPTISDSVEVVCRVDNVDQWRQDLCTLDCESCRQCVESPNTTPTSCWHSDAVSWHSSITPSLVDNMRTGQQQCEHQNSGHYGGSNNWRTYYWLNLYQVTRIAVEKSYKTSLLIIIIYRQFLTRHNKTSHYKGVHQCNGWWPVTQKSCSVSTHIS